MTQLTFAEAEFANKKHKTRRERFLERMDVLIPWAKLERKLAKLYPTGQRGRPPYPLSTMLRVHCIQLFYNLSDPAMEDLLYEVESVRAFAGLRLSQPIPDESTILHFRHFLETHGLGKVVFDTINQHLADHGLILKEGTIVDASILEAPSSTKNNAGQRDPEMHQTKKGNEWHFGMKLHIGVDHVLGLIHSLTTTAANTHDIVIADQLLHGAEKVVIADAGYRGVYKRPEHEHRVVRWLIAARPSQRGRIAGIEYNKASIRSKVEHAFCYIKRCFGYGKVRYRGLMKNTNRLYVLAGFTNLLRVDGFIKAHVA